MIYNQSALKLCNNSEFTTGGIGKTIEKLSSDLPIKRVRADAENPEISGEIREQIQGLNQASRNVQASISLLIKRLLSDECYKDEVNPINYFLLDSLDSSDFTNGRLRGPHHFTVNGTKIVVVDQSTIMDIVNQINKRQKITGVAAEATGEKLKLISLDKFSPIVVKHRKAAVCQIHGIDDRNEFPSNAGMFLLKGVLADGTIKESYQEVELSRSLCNTLTRVQYYISLSSETRVEVDGAGTKNATLRFINRGISKGETPGGIDIRNGIGGGLDYLGGTEGSYKEEIIKTTFEVVQGTLYNQCI